MQLKKHGKREEKKIVRCPMEVRPHTSLKHRIIGSYLKICRDVMKGKRRSLYYSDLYAGDGSCSCKQAPLKNWSPPYVSHMDNAKKNNLDLKCFFNDKNNMDKLSDSLLPYEEFVLGKYDEDANTVYPKILSKIPPEEWSIFVLDPFNHSQLSFSTIEGISKHRSYDSRSRCERKPELIITLMTYTMQQYLKTVGRENVAQEKKERLLSTIDESLGTSNWRQKILGLNKEQREGKVHYIFLKIFLKQLSDLGYDTVFFHINQILNNGPVYHLIFASSIPSAYKIISEKFEPYIKGIKKDKWIKENFTFYKKANARDQGLSLLDDFC